MLSILFYSKTQLTEITHTQAIHSYHCMFYLLSKIKQFKNLVMYYYKVICSYCKIKAKVSCRTNDLR